MLARVNLQLRPDEQLFRQVGLARPVQEFTLVLDVVHFDRVILNN